MSKLTDLQVQRRNANKHTPRGLGALEQSIQQDGWIGAITVAADGETFDGSARIDVGAATGFDEAIVVESDGSKPVIVKRVDIPNTDDPRAVRLGVAANRVAQIDLDWDASILAELAQETDLSQLFREDEMAALLADVRGADIRGAGDDFDTTPDDGPTRTALGELWQIGPHRLIVGDCTDPAVVERLMGGERLRLIVTDPPYGVSYADKNRYLNAVAPANRIQIPIEGDHASVEEIAEQLWRPAFFTMYVAADAGCSLYCFMPQGGDQMMMMMMMMMSSKWPPRHELIWLKNNHVLGRADYAYKHEPIVYAWKEGGHRFYGGFQVSVLQYDKPQKSDLHPTTKPLDLITHLIENSSTANEIIGDWFLGSGTTLIAAHQTGRRCYGCEISPRYADVILRRAELAGLECRLEHQEAESVV